MEIDRFSLSLFRYILHVDYYLEGRRERKSASIISIQNQKYIKLRNTEGGKKKYGGDWTCLRQPKYLLPPPSWCFALTMGISDTKWKSRRQTAERLNGVENEPQISVGLSLYGTMTTEPKGRCDCVEIQKKTGRGFLCARTSSNSFFTIKSLGTIIDYFKTHGAELNEASFRSAFWKKCIRNRSYLLIEWVSLKGKKTVQFVDEHFVQ